MKNSIHYLLILLLLSSTQVFSQNIDSLKIQLLRKYILTDTINIQVMSRRPIEINVAELLNQLDWEKHDPLALAFNDTIVRYTDTISVEGKKNIEYQVEENNQFRWRVLEKYNFSIVKVKPQQSVYSGYSLPIQYARNKFVVYRSYFFESNYTGMKIDFWEWKNGCWKKVKSHTVWMS